MTLRANSYRRALKRVRYRKNIIHLTDRELNDLRHAFEGLYAISATTADDGTVDPAGNADDERGYEWIAGVHGAPPPVYCQHGTLNFATWHRAYLYRFEKLLQDQVPSVTLSWWDWAAPEAEQHGLPAAVTDETYVDLDDGQTKPNPLRSAYNQWTGQPTSRAPRPAAQLATIAASLEFAMVQTEFPEFSANLENPHNQLHVWVGGDMGSVPTAAYDPVFWLHHANVDRNWYMWQQVHPTVAVPAEVRSFVCEPFNMTGADTLDVYALGYSYVDEERMVAADEVRELAAATGQDTVPEEARANATFVLGSVGARYRRATLEFLHLRPPDDSYLAHLFLNNPDATLDTERSLGTGYAGMLALFGHGPCLGGPGHCDVPDRSDDPYDVRPRHHKAPADTYVDVSFPLAEIVDEADGEPVDVDVTFVVEDAEGAPVDPSVLEFESVSLVTRA
ncbi:MAG TPA: tyrosinase family protein [Acidimicrobiales bacterium]|jgi:tyrosinase